MCPPKNLIKRLKYVPKRVYLQFRKIFKTTAAIFGLSNYRIQQKEPYMGVGSVCPVQRIALADILLTEFLCFWMVNGKHC